jgi:hypothetical protein
MRCGRSWQRDFRSVLPGFLDSPLPEFEGQRRSPARRFLQFQAGQAMSDEALPQSEFILYRTEDGRTRIQCRFENESIWLSQALIAELFQKDVRTINEHLGNIFEEGEFRREATIRKFRMVRREGARQVAREVEHYNLDAIIAVGFRVRSQRGTQFRQWATARLGEFLVKGFAMDDERLKNPPGKGQQDYFDELLERIRDICSSERRFYQKVLDIYATSVDYTPDAEQSQRFFAAVQNKMHWATHGHTAAEIIHERADSTRPFMGLQTTRPGGIVRKDDARCQELPDRGRAPGTQPHREPLHRIRGAAGAGAQADDDARLDHQARRVSENFRTRTPGSRGQDFR